MRERIRNIRERYKRYEPFIFFTAGFLFDVFTLRRIDDWIKLIFQILFLTLLAMFLVAQYNEEKDKAGYKPPRLLTKIWPYQIEITHFMFGSMLSAFVIFYFKSASLTRSVIFLFLLVILMVLNELPQIREYGVRLRFALYSFCLASFFIYFLPVVAGFINWLLFFAALILAGLLMWGLVWLATRKESPEMLALNQQRLGVPALVIYMVLLASYLLKVIPPVPLAMTFGGIYHKVEKNKENGAIELYSLKPWYNFWSHGDSDFKMRAGDVIYCFVRIFAPARFDHTIKLGWSLKDAKGHYILQDKIPMEIHGGREDGFRGYVYKSHFQPGQWRVDVETQDERVIGNIYFKVEEDVSTDDRIWMVEHD